MPQRGPHDITNLRSFVIRFSYYRPRRRTVLLHRINFNIAPSKYGVVRVIRRQFPVRLQYASTIHSSQGRTLDAIVADLRLEHSPFTHGMLYTELSRVRKRGDCVLLVDPSQVHQQSGCIKVRNVVYTSFLKFVK